MRKSEALAYRAAIEKGVQSLPKAVALTVPALHPAWAAGKQCDAGTRWQYGGRLYEVNAGMGHVAQADWPPNKAVSLFTPVDETHDGTADDPIPYVSGMVLEQGKYYTEGGVVYHCCNGSGIAVHAALADMAAFVEEVAE